MIVAGGGVLYSEASEALARFAEQTGIPVGETQAGKGSLRYDDRQNMGAIGATGTLSANRLAYDADLVIGVGTRYSDFTTASKTAFQNPEVRFVNINLAEFDAFKHAAIPLTADARLTLHGVRRERPQRARERVLRGDGLADALKGVTQNAVFTTHTPLPAGKLLPKPTMVQVRFGPTISMENYRSPGAPAKKNAARQPRVRSTTPPTA